MRPAVFLELTLLISMLCGCERSSGVPAETPRARGSHPTPVSLERQAAATYTRGEFERAADLFERACEQAPSNVELEFQLARAWAQSDRTVEAQDRIGNLLLAQPDRFRSRIEADPAFHAEGFAQLLATGGATDLTLDAVPHAEFDLDADGSEELLVISRRESLDEQFLTLVVQTPAGPVARRLLDVALGQPRLTPFALGSKGCALLLEDAGTNAVQAELHLLWGASALDAALIYSQAFVLDGGDGDAPLPVNGALSFSVIDVIVGAEPELVLTWVDPWGEPSGTQVLEIDAGRVRNLGAAKAEREAAALRLGSDRTPLTRPIAEALVRLQPEKTAPRLTLLAAADVETQSEWWGFYPPGSNEFIALHGAYYARHVDATARTLLAKLPRVASFLARWKLTTDDLATQREPLIPPSPLWGRASFLEPSDASTSFSYFRLH